MDVNVLQVIGVFTVVLGASTFSGMSGGGGGVIIVPFLIALGLSPQQAIATTKFGGFGVSFGSIAAFKKKAFENTRLVIYLMLMAALISLAVPVIFNHLSGNTFQLVIGIIMLALIPNSLSKKHGIMQQQTSRIRKIVGSFLLAIVFLLQGVFSSGVGSLNNMVLSSFFGLTALQAASVRRFASLALNTFIVISLIFTTNFIVYQYAFAAFTASLIGGYLGARIALKKGNQFTKYALAGFMFISGVVLLVTAI
jgi:hypothetical protein